MTFGERMNVECWNLAKHKYTVRENGRSVSRYSIWYLYHTYRWHFNLLVPSCYVMHHRFNIQQLYALPTLYFCVLYLSENKQRLVPVTA